jgi:hypothetical protein
VSDSYAFAQTSPVYVVRGGRPWTSAADALFLAEAVEALRARLRNAGWRSEAERAAFAAAIDEALAVYRRIAAR